MQRLFAISPLGPEALALPAAADRLEDVYAALDLGVYSSFRTYEHRKFLGLEHHLARIQRSMQRLGWDYELDTARLRRCLDRVCTDAPCEEMRVRCDVLAAPAAALGSASRELVALSAFAPPPRSLYEHGVAVATTDAIARDDPVTKTARFVEDRRRIESATPDVYERLIVSPNGEILEGFSSNFYVVRDGRLHTAGTGVLEGVTRRLVLELAARDGIAVELRAPRRDELGDIDEAAISSSSRGLVPVVRIDGVSVGRGVPGPIVRRLGAAYDARVAETIRPAV